MLLLVQEHLSESQSTWWSLCFDWRLFTVTYVTYINALHNIMYCTYDTVNIVNVSFYTSG